MRQNALCVKLASSSTAFDQQLRSGALTQLEWIDLCAHELAADGIVLDVRHFPRSDGDYLAQIKKMAADVGLSVAALRHDGFFGSDHTHMEQTVGMAIALGAPLLSAPLPPETDANWTQVQERLGTATALAKRHNVTIAVRNAPHTFAACSHDLKRVSKEADSAWLRYGPDFSALDAGSDAEALLPKTVLVWSELGSEPLAEMLSEYRGFVAMDAAQGDASSAEMKNALRRWRTAFLVNRT